MWGGFLKHYLFLMHLLVNCDHVRLCEKRNFINLTRDIIVSILFPTQSGDHARTPFNLVMVLDV